jgi:hypothetical protein
VDPAEAADPTTVLNRDRSAFHGIMLRVAGGSGFALGFALGLAGGRGLAGGLVAGLVLGLMAGLSFGLSAGFKEAAWGWFAVARCWLALRGRLPWRLMGFLADAHQRGVLRQAGAVYQFRHAELQRHLAGRS